MNKSYKEYLVESEKKRVVEEEGNIKEFIKIADFLEQKLQLPVNRGIVYKFLRIRIGLVNIVIHILFSNKIRFKTVITRYQFIPTSNGVKKVLHSRLTISPASLIYTGKELFAEVKWKEKRPIITEDIDKLAEFLKILIERIRKEDIDFYYFFKALLP